MDSNSKKHSPSFSKSKTPESSGNQSHETCNSSSIMPPYSEGVSSPNYGMERKRKRSPTKEKKPLWHLEPEQIEILEDIFDSGMVSPPREEITRIKTILEEFGELREVNVLYWFMYKKAGICLNTPGTWTTSSTPSTSTCVQSKPITELVNSNHNNSGDQPNSSSAHYDQQVNKEMSNNQPSNMQAEGILNEGTEGMVEDSIINTDPIVTVFINKVPTDFPTGPINVRDFFGHDAVLFHSSGEPVRENECGFILEGLQHGAMYFLLTSTCVQSTPLKDLFYSNYDNIGDQRSSSSVVPVSSFSGHHYDPQGNKEMSNNQPNNMQGAGILNEATGAVQESIDADAIITVFINDIPTNFPIGPINHRALFGDEALLFHSSGKLVPVNESGYTLEGLEHGALYFLQITGVFDSTEVKINAVSMEFFMFMALKNGNLSAGNACTILKRSLHNSNSVGKFL